MPNAKLVSRKQMNPEGDYSYCPYCRSEAEAEGKNYKEVLPPLFKVVTAKWDNEVEREILDTHYECPKCKAADITVETFLKVYCQ